jgi:catechol 2,3-dioxygenase-like lactoylglutathione lyase family enzyme
MQLAFLAPPNHNDFVIEIFGYNKPKAVADSETKSGYNHICFNVENLDQAMDILRERNINIVRTFDVEPIGKRVAFITDPFGNTIEFSEDIR